MFLATGERTCDVAEITEILQETVVIKNLLTNRLELLTFPRTGAAPHKTASAGGRVGLVRYSSHDDLCPPYASVLSQRNRSESREVIRRFRSLTPADQQALIEFLKQL